MRILILIFSLVILTGCARPQIVVQEFSPQSILHMKDLKQVKPTAALSDYAFFLDKGDTIPIKLELSSELIQWQEEEVHLVLKKKIYFRALTLPHATEGDRQMLWGLNPEKMKAMSQQELRQLLEKVQFYVSTDATTWAPLTDMRALKQVLAFKGGTFSAKMAISGDEGVWVLLSLIMYPESQA